MHAGGYALGVVLGIGLGLMARPAEAAPFAYVVNGIDNTVSVIDTATNTVVGSPIPVGAGAHGVAVTPDGTRAYVANVNSSTVSVIDTTTNPNTVVATVTVGSSPQGVAVTPDGTRAYVANVGSNNVSVINTTTNMVVGSPILVGAVPAWVAVTPDGTRAYVANVGSANVSVIDTNPNDIAYNTVVATVAVGVAPFAVAVTTDGTRAYVTNRDDNNVSVINTTTNMVVGSPILVGNDPVGVGIKPPSQGVPFLAFSAKLQIRFAGAPNKDAFALESSFTLSSTASNGINPVTEPVTLQVGTFTTSRPAPSRRPVGRSASWGSSAA